MTKETLIDSNIIVYSINSSSVHHKGALKIIQELENPVISIQNFLESLKVLTDSRFKPNLLLHGALEKLSPITKVARVIFPDIKSFAILTELLVKYKVSGIKIYDANLVATMLANEIYTIVTANTKDFKKYRGIEVLGFR